MWLGGRSNPLCTSRYSDGGGLLLYSPEVGEVKGVVGSPSHPCCPVAPMGGMKAGCSAAVGNTHIWVLRAQCWLRGRQAGEEETEKQSRLSLKGPCTHLTE